MKTGTYQILRGLYTGAKRFTELEDSVPTKTLADRLKELENSGYISRVILKTRPPRTEYRITMRGGEKFKELVLQSAPDYVEDLFLVAPEKAKEILTKYR